MERFYDSPVSRRGVSRQPQRLLLPLRPAGQCTFLAALGLAWSLLLSGSCALALAQPHPPAHPQPGYLGVSLLDLDADLAARLRLHDTHGALIVTIDREAPAASAGLRPRDVILEVNGQRMDNVDQLRHRLHDTPSGSTVTLRISRDGAEQTLSVQLGDQAEIAQRAWEQHFNAPGIGADNSAPDAAPQPGFAPPSGHGSAGSSFLGVFSINALYTGAEIDPLSTQLAEYFGVHDGAGLLVRSVNDNSPASSAGLRAGDVILRVNNQPVVSRMDWVKQLHANRGRAVQLSVMRNRHEQVLSMTAGKGKKG